MISDEYLNHPVRLIVAATLSSSDYITGVDIEIAHNLLCRFVREFKTLCGLRHCFIDVHQLLHYANRVRNLGPLWVYTYYEYKNINGLLLRNIHETGNIDTQVARA